MFSLSAGDGTSRRISYLGLTPASEDWLSEAAGPGFTGARSAELARLLADPAGGDLPEDTVGQVVRALERLAAHGPLPAGATLGVMPLGFGPDSGTGTAHSHDAVAGGPACLAGTFRANSTGSQLLAQGGVGLATAAAGRPWAAGLASLTADEFRRAGHPVSLGFVVDDNRLYVLSVARAELAGAVRVRQAVRGTRSAGHGQDPDSMPSENDLVRALAPQADTTGLTLLARGIGLAPGVASGRLVFRSEEAEAAAGRGHRVVLAVTESRPEDLGGLLAADAVITQRGGRSSHAGVVARSLRRPSVTALADAVVDPGAGAIRLGDGTLVAAGTEVTVDGSAGLLHRGAVRGTPTAAGAPQTEPGLSAWLDRHASGPHAVDVRVNADSARDAAAGRAAGATGIGLCRTEHMFLGERKSLLERVLLAGRGPDLHEGLHRIETFLRAEFTEILRAMDGLPAVVRLLDPPRHEFLPQTVDRLREHNPLLGVRGVRLGALMPELAAAQIRALSDAAAALRRAGADPRPELLVPMVSTPAEMEFVRTLVAEVRDRSQGAGGPALPCGAMIETPRAALLAGEIARHSDFLSIGTNDLTALVWGLSRDDAELELLPSYESLGLLDASPFDRFDRDAVGALVRRAIGDARAVRPGLAVGVCGGHAAVGEALRFFADCGADYVSCPAPLVQVARYTSTRAG
ncbi:hypothetical protein LG634_19330 [Streptomyces bambusae]|uniref:putative PEP-binding protein n=1 Tax=Streptomyces bambusae TaxID=1550616 RepID=UPI001CFD43DA|nr:putative PEP-binding protein [Streptomyces bambusae]MCB5166983.1 hypothetical protein [Streptomyces bambusae]